ncbi:hypothetical protein ATN79_20200 [Paraburkholderia caribensis]|nr:hypothetical protein ATN79_20200 [Paraburkholderia caribensis]
MRGDTMPVLLERYGLLEYFRTKDLTLSVQGLSAGLTRIMTVARLTVLTFSGMRDGESSDLKYECLKKHISYGRMHFEIHGTSTKLNGGDPKKVKWVTNQDGARAIELVKRITKLNHELFVRRTNNCALDEKDIPLFASVSYFGFQGAKLAEHANQMIHGHLDLDRLPKLRALLQPPIEDADLQELEEIDLHRAWRSEEKFQVGVPWNFTCHQLRRSLAVYAQRSGLVSLPSLRRQLQHITEEMSRYYAKGSSFAQNFIGDCADHFALEWREMQPVSAALSYIKHVLCTDEALFGGHGNWIEHRLRDKSGEIEIDREITVRRFEKGEIAFRETNLGGCTNTERCDKRPVRWLNIDCVKGCKHLVGQLGKLERVIVFQERLVGSLDPSSGEYQSERTDLDLLVSVRDKVRAQASRGGRP